MSIKISKVTASLMVIFSAYSLSSVAAMKIVSSGDRVDLSLSKKKIDNVADAPSLNKKDIVDNKITGGVTNFPLGLAVDTITPKGWTSNVGRDVELKEISWTGDAQWDDILDYLSETYNLSVNVDWDSKSILVDSDGAELTEGELGEVEHGRLNNLIVCSEDGKKFEVSSLIDPAKGGLNHRMGLKSIGNCGEGKIDIEKLVMDTDWNLQESVDKENKRLADAEKEDKELDKRIEEEQANLDRKNQVLYNKSYIVHGDGSYEDFLNGGGFIDVNQANPKSEYTYVYKKGRLFDTIDKWAEANGYTVKNDISDYMEQDFINHSDVSVKGDMYGVLDKVLGKYSKSDVPVNHAVYENGKIIHIFAGKYKSGYSN